MTLEGDALEGELGSRGLGSDMIQVSSDLKHTPVTALIAFFERPSICTQTGKGRGRDLLSVPYRFSESLGDRGRACVRDVIHADAFCKFVK